MKKSVYVRWHLKLVAWKNVAVVRPVLFLDIDCCLLCFDFVVVVLLKEKLFYKGTLSTKVYKYDSWGNDLMIVCNFTLSVLLLVLPAFRCLVWWNYQLYCAQAVLGNALQIHEALSCSSVAPFTSQTHLQSFKMCLQYCFAFSFLPFFN